ALKGRNSIAQGIALCRTWRNKSLGLFRPYRACEVVAIIPGAMRRAIEFRPFRAFTSIIMSNSR
ncbi:MAG: hypothetical protein WBV94_24265, partial [Blastocatellia bacterium]